MQWISVRNYGMGVRVAAKKRVIFLMAMPLGGGGGKGDISWKISLCSFIYPNNIKRGQKRTKEEKVNVPSLPSQIKFLRALR